MSLRSSMSFSFKLLTDTYRCLISGSCPQHSPADVAAVLFSSVCGLVSSTAEDVKVESEKQSTSELCCISLTVIDNMNLLLTQDTPGDVTLFFETCLIKLFRDMDVMTQLVSFCSPGVSSLVRVQCPDVFLSFFLQWEKTIICNCISFAQCFK